MQNVKSEVMSNGRMANITNTGYCIIEGLNLRDVFKMNEGMYS